MVRDSHKSQLSGHSFLLPSEKELSWYFPFSSWIAPQQSQEETDADPKGNQNQGSPWKTEKGIVLRGSDRTQEVAQDAELSVTTAALNMPLHASHVSWAVLTVKMLGRLSTHTSWQEPCSCLVYMQQCWQLLGNTEPVVPGNICGTFLLSSAHSCDV